VEATDHSWIAGNPNTTIGRTKRSSQREALSDRLPLIKQDGECFAEFVHPAATWGIAGLFHQYLWSRLKRSRDSTDVV
jgi:hypothetical protein